MFHNYINWTVEIKVEHSINITRAFTEYNEPNQSISPTQKCP